MILTERDYQELAEQIHEGGTGAWVTTVVFLYVNRWLYLDEDGRETECNFDECKLQEWLTALRVG